MTDILAVALGLVLAGGLLFWGSRPIKGETVYYGSLFRDEK